VAAALARVILPSCFSLRTRSFVWTSSRTIVATSWRISAHSWSVRACDVCVMVPGKYTHPLLCWPMFRVCQARTSEDRRLLSLLPVQHGKRQGHNPASRILFQLHQTILQTPCECELRSRRLAKEFVVSQTGWEERRLTSSNFAVLDDSPYPR